jgi:hypothetical protein
VVALGRERAFSLSGMVAVRGLQTKRLKLDSRRSTEVAKASDEAAQRERAQGAEGAEEARSGVEAGLTADTYDGVPPPSEEGVRMEKMVGTALVLASRRRRC